MPSHEKRHKHTIITVAIGAAVFALTVVAAVSTAPAASAAAAPKSKPVQIVRVIAPTVAYENPGFGAAVKSLGTTTPYGHDQLALRVMRSVPGEVDPVTGVQRTYYQVHLPYRRSKHDTSSGNVGWVSSDTVQVFTSPWAVRVNRAHRTLTVLKNGKKYDSWKVVVGKHATPTPAGHFAVYGKTHRASVDGPYGLLTFAYSAVYTTFGPSGDPLSGGQGNVGIHGVTASLHGAFGSANSHGCVRNPNLKSKWLIDNLPIGTPVDVV